MVGVKKLSFCPHFHNASSSIPQDSLDHAPRSVRAVLRSEERQFCKSGFWTLSAKDRGKPLNAQRKLYLTVFIGKW